MAAARVVFPPALQGLDRQRITAAIKIAPLGRVDRKIALLRYVERLPLPDIAAQTHYSRTTVGYRLKGIALILEESNGCRKNCKQSQ
nr:MAG TPA: ECF sigma factor [Caudoviricetes sp.]